MSEEKAIILLFRSAIGMGSFVEEFLNLHEQIATTVEPVKSNAAIEISKDNMEVYTDYVLRQVCIDPMENSWRNT